MKGRKAAGDLVKKLGFLNMILITPPENYKDSLYILFNDTGKMLFEKTLPDPVMKRPNLLILTFGKPFDRAYKTFL